MKTIVKALLAFLMILFRSRATLRLEIVALQHQLTDYQRTTQRPGIQPGIRLFWCCLSRWWSGWRRDSVCYEFSGTTGRKMHSDRLSRFSVPAVCSGVILLDEDCLQ
ncbi:MAG: hypothetical protein WAL92_03745 [Thiogranum sp.]